MKRKLKICMLKEKIIHLYSERNKNIKKKKIFWFHLNTEEKYIRTRNIFPWLIIAIVATWYREIPFSCKVLYSLMLIGVYLGQLVYCYNKFKKQDEL